MSLKESLSVALSLEPLCVEAHALVVTKREDQKLRDALANQGINSVHSNRAWSWAEERLNTDDRISLLIVDLEEVEDDGCEFIRRAAFEHPELRLVAMTESTTGLAHLSQAHFMRTHSAPEELAIRCHALMADHYYDLEVVDAMSSALARLLEGRAVAPQSAFLRASSSTMGAVTAIVEIAGLDLCGRIQLSADQDGARVCAEHLLGRRADSLHEIWDGLGEIANMFASDLRLHYEYRGLDSNQSPPTIFSGLGASVQRTYNPLSVVVPFLVEGVSRPLYAEWILTYKTPDSEIDENDINPESVVFL